MCLEPLGNKMNLKGGKNKKMERDDWNAQYIPLEIQTQNSFDSIKSTPFAQHSSVVQINDFVNLSGNIPSVNVKYNIKR